MKIYILFIIASLATLVGCADPAKKTDLDKNALNNQVLIGQVFYRERKMLPPGATLEVTLEDVSKMDVASTVLASDSSEITGAPPYDFTLEYDNAVIDARMQYAVRAKIMLGNKLLFISTEHIDPFKGSSEGLMIKLTMVQHHQAKEAQHAETGLAVVSVNPLADLVNTYWKLISVDNNVVVMDSKQQKEAFLQLQSDGKTKGFGGCNLFQGSFIQKGNDLSFGPSLSTQKACMAGMETETNFLKALNKTSYYSIHKETLTILNDKKQKIAKFEAVYFN